MDLIFPSCVSVINVAKKNNIAKVRMEWHETYHKLEIGEYCLAGMFRVILARETTDTEALLAYTVVTVWLANNEPDKYDAALNILKPFMRKYHSEIMDKL